MLVCRAKQQPRLHGEAHDGSRLLGAELTPESLGYFSLQSCRDFDPDLYDFFGHCHYVEVADQSYGRYGGLHRLSIEDGGACIVMNFTYDLPTGERALRVICPARLAGEELAWIEALSRDIAVSKGGDVS